MSRRAPQLPLWTRWVLAVTVFASLGLAAFLFARGRNSTAPTLDAQGTIEANAVGQIVVRQDQAPHVAGWRADSPAARALRDAIIADVRARIASRDLTGPLGSVSCAPVRRASHQREPFVCSVVSASLAYTFYGVADRGTRTLTWCKQDPVEDAGLAVPLSASCQR